MDHSTEQSSVNDSTSCGSVPRVLHECEQWMVLQKPAGWHSVAVQRSSGGEVLSNWLAAQHPPQSHLPDAGLVQRLDQCTSGCVIAAKSEAMHRVLRDAVSGRGERSIAKVYLALVKRGLETEGRFDLVFSSRHKGSSKATVRRAGDGERGACCWRVVRASAGNDADSDHTAAAFDLIEVQLQGPGRRHQIRAGMAFLGHPLAGDSLYRGESLSPPWSGGCFALHAWRVTVDGVMVESPRPTWAKG